MVHAMQTITNIKKEKNLVKCLIKSKTIEFPRIFKKTPRKRINAHSDMELSWDSLCLNKYKM
jgi:hypothetical protein